MFERFKKAILNLSKEDKAAGDLAGLAISITIFLVIVAYILAPVGLTAMNNTNTTQAGVATGTNANIWNAIVPIVLAVLIIGLVYFLKSESRQ